MPDRYDKKDQLHVCNTMGVPLPEFQHAWCNLCFNPECTRSLAGTTKFEARTSTWKDRLFDNPLKMAPEDPRYSEIIAHKFIEIPTGGALEIGGQKPASEWLDPRDLEPKEPEKPKPTPRKVAKPEPIPEPVEEPIPEPVEEPVEEPVDKPELSKQVKPLVPKGPLQTPFKQGTLLDGKTKISDNEPDPWAAPEAQKPLSGVKTMKPGGKFKFGGK